MRPRIVAAMALALAACAGSADAEPQRSYAMGLTVDDSEDRYRYLATDTVDIRVGDEVTFELTNTGSLIHDVQVVDPDGTMVAKSELAAPGVDVTVTARFDQAGFYRLNCLVDDHLTVHEMQTFIEVTQPSG